jgi:ubiquitin C-terminal hydrolase
MVMSSIDTIKTMMSRNTEIREAHKKYPTLELGSAYSLWKSERGEITTSLRSDKDQQARDAAKVTIKQFSERPCTANGCSGIAVLEPICSGCIEGKAGYKTKWTCQKCLHRELSKKELPEWITELSQS